MDGFADAVPAGEPCQDRHLGDPDPGDRRRCPRDLHLLPAGFTGCVPRCLGRDFGAPTRRSSNMLLRYCSGSRYGLFIAGERLSDNPPSIPYAVPAQLLERRPDIAQEERRMAAANAQIGIARAAFYPNVTLSAAAGLGATSITNWFTWPSRFWSVGPALAQSLFDGGLRRAAVQQSQALYLQTIANYRQTTLVAFQQVEDNLAALRILSKEIQEQDAAIQSAQRNLQVATDRYRAGIDPYLNVITAQTTLLSTQQTAVNLRRNQMVASVQLVEALGGGWNAAELPTPEQVSIDPLSLSGHNSRNILRFDIGAILD